MKLKRRVQILPLLLTLIFLVTACGQASEPSLTPDPTKAPVSTPTDIPAATPTEAPAATPTEAPKVLPTEAPEVLPTEAPEVLPTEAPEVLPTEAPEVLPTEAPEVLPTETPEVIPTEIPEVIPTEIPEATPTPSPAPTATPTPTATLTPTASPTPTPSPAPTASPTPTPATLREAMIQRSLMQTGNNHRLKKAIEKAANGEEVVIAYIGGSITEGANADPQATNCYAYRSYEYFKEMYAHGGDNVKFVNAGLSGTPSTVGMIRYEEDVISKFGEPDIVIFEFAVNDGDDPTNGVCYESLVKDILQSEKDPAVVLLFCATESLWNLQDSLSSVGTHYDLPMISIKDAFGSAFTNGDAKSSEFFSADGLHPNTEGHQFMADCINYMFNVIDNETTIDDDITIPATTVFGDAFVGIKALDSTSTDQSVTLSAGAFTAPDEETFGNSFKKGWKKLEDSANDSFMLTVTCKNLVLLYKSAGDWYPTIFGNADLYLDGTKIDTLVGSGGWANTLAKIIVNDTVAAEHTIEIKMAEGDENKSFTILAIGYTE